MNDLAIAFVMGLDKRGVSFERGIEEAEKLAEEILGAAEDRDNAPRDESE
jgi:hypothetical protein